MIETYRIVGVGLIGGSFGLALRKRGSADAFSVSVRRRRSTRRWHAARSIRARRSRLRLLPRMFSSGRANRNHSRHHRPSSGDDQARCAGYGCRKHETRDCRSSSVELSDVVFVGGHPMAGKEKTGVGEAEPDLFRVVRGHYAPRTPSFWTATTPASLWTCCTALAPGHWYLVRTSTTVQSRLLLICRS